MIKLDLEKYIDSDLPSMSFVLDEKGLLLAYKILNAEGARWYKGVSMQYVIGYVPRTGGQMDPASFTTTPKKGYHMVIVSLPDSVRVDPRRIKSIDEHFDDDGFGDF